MAISTNADVRGRGGWSIDDLATQLRRWGEAASYDLTRADAWILGGDPDPKLGGTALPVADPSGKISRSHARLVREESGWNIFDLESTNGLWINGERRQSSALTAGAELRLGDVVLIAESPRLLALHQLLERFIGWHAARRPDVDRAMQAIREMACARAALILSGAGDLGVIVRRIHACVLGMLPLVSDAAAWMQLPPTQQEPCMLCMSVDALPKEVTLIAADTRRPDTAFRVVLCTEHVGNASAAAAMFARTVHVEIPSLRARWGEVPRLLIEYAQDAATRLGLAATGLRDDESEWLCKLELGSHAELEELALRLVSLRNGGVTAGAARLGITHVALSRWAQRRGITW